VLGFGAITIAALNGHAFAGGAMLATAHDFVVMRDDRGYWCLPEVDLGLPLTPAMHAVITARLPRVTAHEAMMTGRRYTAAEGLAAGIVDRTAPEADVVPQAIAWAEELAAKDRAVIAAHKQLTYDAALAVCEGHLPGGPEAA
jgi:Delta3-Delta2-enoyl-CoA isomerase